MCEQHPLAPGTRTVAGRSVCVARSNLSFRPLFRSRRTRGPTIWSPSPSSDYALRSDSKRIKALALMLVARSVRVLFSENLFPNQPKKRVYKAVFEGRLPDG